MTNRTILTRVCGIVNDHWHNDYTASRGNAGLIISYKGLDITTTDFRLNTEVLEREFKHEANQIILTIMNYVQNNPK